MIVFLVFGILFMVVAIVLFLTDADKKKGYKAVNSFNLLCDRDA